MRAFIKSDLSKTVAMHLARFHYDHDSLIQGRYQAPDKKTGKFRGCLVGCMAHGKHANFAKDFSIDPRIGAISDTIHERLPENTFKDFTVQLFENIAVGRDTTLVFYKFTEWFLIRLQESAKQKHPDLSKIIGRVVGSVADLILLHEAASECVLRREFKSWYTQLYDMESLDLPLGDIRTSVMDICQSFIDYDDSRLVTEKVTDAIHATRTSVYPSCDEHNGEDIFDLYDAETLKEKLFDLLKGDNDEQ